MTTAAKGETLREIDEDIRQAWAVYSEELRGLTGKEYERVEDEQWSQLRSELEQLERRRKELAGAPA